LTITGVRNGGAIILSLLFFLFLLSFDFVTTPLEAISLALRPHIRPSEVMLEVQTPVRFLFPILDSCTCNRNVLISPINVLTWFVIGHVASRAWNWRIQSDKKLEPKSCWVIRLHAAKGHPGV
jgi:hypothetical protein